MNFGGAGGANEIRWAATGAGATNTTASASWPYSTRPTSGTAVVAEMYSFPTDGAGNKLNYDGTNTHYLVLRTSFSNDGTFASAPRFSAFATSAHPAPSPGTQTASTGDGANIINGQQTDTSNTSYLKATAFGFGSNGSGQQTPAAAPAAIGATNGTAGSVATTTGAWTAWQSMQGWTQYITNGSIISAMTTNPWFWYFQFVLYYGQNMAPGSMPFSPFTFDYTYS